MKLYIGDITTYDSTTLAIISVTIMCPLTPRPEYRSHSFWNVLHNHSLTIVYSLDSLIAPLIRLYFGYTLGRLFRTHQQARTVDALRDTQPVLITNRFNTWRTPCPPSFWRAFVFLARAQPQSGSCRHIESFFLTGRIKRCPHHQGTYWIRALKLGQSWQ